MIRTPTKTFKMPKELKRMLAVSNGNGSRAGMIDAQLCSEIVPKTKSEREATDKVSK